ncbi:TPA: magnesium transporter CorA family protein, partial [Streptococcus equi subsp. equi]|nr:magnesium transporter CorA family protein [Streptococcus equi subsp. equi]
DIPTVIFSAYGMNFQDNWLPLNGLSHAFWYIVLLATLLSSFVVIYFIRKKWF